MKAKKSLILTVAAVLTGIFAITLSGCEWFSFNKNAPQGISDQLGYEGDTAAWLTSSASSPRFDALAGYQEAVDAGKIDPSKVSFLDYLKLINEDSASLTSALRSSVAIVARENSTSDTAAFGSGVVYSLSSDGGSTTAYVITNYHVVYNENTRGFHGDIRTFLYGDHYDMSRLSSALTATYVGGSQEQDIAVLSMEVPAGRVSYVQSIGRDVGKRDSDDAVVGERVYAIGNTLGAGISVLSGSVAVEAEYVETKISMRIDAPVNHGNSGGGLFDRDGKFLGIVYGGHDVTVKTDDGNGTIAVDGFGYAIPANRAVSVAQNIIDNLDFDSQRGAYYGRLGQLEIQSSVGEFDSSLQKINIVETVAVKQVDARSPFAGTDIEGKKITRIIVQNGSSTPINQTITRMHQVETILFNLRLNDHVTIVYEGGYAEADYTDARTHFCTTK